MNFLRFFLVLNLTCVMCTVIACVETVEASSSLTSRSQSHTQLVSAYIYTHTTLWDFVFINSVVSWAIVTIFVPVNTRVYTYLRNGLMTAWLRHIARHEIATAVRDDRGQPCTSWSAFAAFSESGPMCSCFPIFVRILFSSVYWLEIFYSTKCLRSKFHVQNSA